MSDRQNQRMLHTLAETNRVHGQTSHTGSVSEVKAEGGEQKVRVQIGTKADGSPLLSPWLHTGDHRGSAREEFKYKKGQNVVISAPSGDLRQGVVYPYAESDAIKRPDHASDDAETYQFERLRITKKKDQYEVWIAREKQQGASGATGAAQSDQEPGKPQFLLHVDGDKVELTFFDQDDKKLSRVHQDKDSLTTTVYDADDVKSNVHQDKDVVQTTIVDGDEVKWSSRVSRDDGITARYQNKNRFSVTSGGVKMKAQGTYLVVVNGAIIFSRQPVIGPDPLPNDDN